MDRSTSTTWWVSHRRSESASIHIGLPIPQAYGVNWDDYAKILVERVALGDGDLSATILRLPMVYGPGAPEVIKRRFFAYLKRIDDGRPAILLDDVKILRNPMAGAIALEYSAFAVDGRPEPQESLPPTAECRPRDLKGRERRAKPAIAPHKVPNIGSVGRARSSVSSLPRGSGASC
jgi:hypothetical protein